MITFVRARPYRRAEARWPPEPGWRTGDQTLLDVVWRNGRIDMMLSPLWVHVVGVDMSPVARMRHRMELDLVRCRQQALMRGASSLPGPVERSLPGRFTCRPHGRMVRADEEPVQ